MKYPKFTIVIPLYVRTPYFDQTVAQCLKLDYPNFEIFIGVDHGIKLDFKSPKIKVLPTGLVRTGPAEKRDICILRSKSDYIAFLDDDSYPRPDWLHQALNQFTTHPEVAGIGGPGLTPPEDSFSQQITGAILSTFWGTGPYTNRFTQQKPQYVDDYPAYNLIVKRTTLLKVGGFDNRFYGGEDTALCIKLINAGEKILYHPDVVVYHHRRPFPAGYLKQVGNVGHHRGYFVKKYPQTSLRPSYFMPLAGVVVTLVATVTALFFPFARLPVLVGGGLLYLLGVVDALRFTRLSVAIVLPACIYLSHVSYGYSFLVGLVITSNLDR